LHIYCFVVADYRYKMKTDKNSPIGLFDSGLGGLTILKEIRSFLPREDIIYYADFVHVPYGDRQLEEIEGYALDIIAYLKSRGVKAIIIACNTSSSVLLDRLFGDNIVIQNLIPPALKGALDVSSNGRIGMIANPATVASKAHERMLRKLTPRAELVSIPCPRLVPLIEAGHIDGDEIDEALDEYLSPLVKKGIDSLILGCTHYPLAYHAIRRHLPSRVTIVDPAEEAVMSMREKLMKLGMTRREAGYPDYEFVASAPKIGFNQYVEDYLGMQDVHSKVLNLWQTAHIVESSSRFTYPQ